MTASDTSDTIDLREAARGALAAKLPVRWMDEHAVLPLAVEGDELLVAAASPLPPLVADALQRVFGARPRVVERNGGEIRAAILSSERTARLADGATNDAATGERAESLDDLRADASREPVVQVVNALLSEAIRIGASDVHVEAALDGLRVRMRRDGVLQDVQQLGESFRLPVVSRLKVLAGLDISERRMPQDGRTRVSVNGRELDLRVSTLPALHGESVVLRLLDRGGDAVRSLDGLGFAEDTLAALRRVVSRGSGLVLVTGPTGSGKSSTLYGALAERSTPGVKVVTVEDPVEYRLDGIVQLPVNPRAGFGFANALRAIVRHDPDVILVGEMRDAETAEVAIQAALTGHLVLSTLHTTDATGALARLVEMGIAPYLVAATLQGVLAQRLVRTVCAECAQWEPATQALRELLGAQTPEQMRVAVGCRACAGSGYRGRVAIGEMLVLDDRVRSAFLAGRPVHELRAVVRSAGVRSLRDDATRLVRTGATTLTEVLRVTGDDDVT